MTVGYCEYGPGLKSMGRLLALIITLTGVLVAVSGVGLAIAAFAVGRDIGAAVGMIGIGVGVDVSGAIMKNWSKGVEAHADSTTKQNGREAGENV